MKKHPAHGESPTSHPPHGKALTLTNLVVSIRRHPVVHHLSARFEPGLTAIVGPNGAGKTTLLRSLAGLIPVESGRIFWPAGGRPGSRPVAYLPQVPGHDSQFPITVLEAVLLGYGPATGVFSALPRDGVIRAREALKQTGLEGLEDRPLGALSGGELRRVLFARTLLSEAPVWLLDEPLAGVDIRAGEELLHLMAEIAGRGKIILAVIHDLEAVRRSFPRTLLLSRIGATHGATKDVLTPEALARAWQLTPVPTEEPCDIPEVVP